MNETLQTKEDFHDLFHDHYGALCNFANRILRDRVVAEDVVQSVFIRLWENRKSLQLKGSIRSYLMSAVKNASLDHIRAEKRKQKLLRDSVDLEVQASVVEEVGLEYFRYKLFEAIKTLKPKTQEIFTLHKIEGLTYNEISEHLDIPRRTVEYNVYAALAQLKEKLKDDYEKYVAA